MGTHPTPSIMIKTLLASALLALTAAEADPQLLYGAGLPYAAGVPYVGATVGAVAHAPVVKVSDLDNKHSHLYQYLPPSTQPIPTTYLPTSILYHLSPLTESAENAEVQ